MLPLKIWIIFKPSANPMEDGFIFRLVWLDLQDMGMII